jgi:hypothetical protein
MDLFDKVALWGRKYEVQVNPRTGLHRFSPRDILEDFQLKTIVELTPHVNGHGGETHRPDPVRRLKISLLDEGGAVFGGSDVGWYEVHSTAPSGDLARVKVIAVSPQGTAVGELRMLLAYRMPELYFKEDPIFASVARQSEDRPG